MERRTLALKHVSNALNLDSNGFYQAAFAKYLQSLQILSLYLNDLYVSLGFQKIIEKRMEVIHVLSMIHECSDRIAAIANEKGGHSQNLCLVQNIQEDPGQTDLPRTFPAYEKMQKENLSILRMYENRLEKTTDKSAKTNLKLELERRLAENRIVTKAKYDAAVKKLQKERVQIMEKEIRKLFQIDKPLNEKEKEKRQTYFSVVNYAKTEMWPCSWKLNCSEYSLSEASQKVFMKIIRCPTHPLLHWMIMIQTKIKREVDHIFQQYSDYVPALIDHQLESSYKLEEFETELVLKSSKGEKNVKIPLEKLVHLKSILENTSFEITSTIENFLEIFYLVYKSLLPDDSEVLCYKLTEDHLLKPIWPTLIILYRVLNISSEYKIYESMSTSRTSNPSNFGIRSVATENSTVHAECISLLKKILGCTSIVEKLQILVQVTQRICDGNAQAENQQRRIGADELIPQLCFVILQSKLPQLNSECFALEQLFDMKFTLGEEGYALSSFITALKYIEIKKLMDFENSEEAVL